MNRHIAPLVGIVFSLAVTACLYHCRNNLISSESLETLFRLWYNPSTDSHVSVHHILINAPGRGGHASLWSACSCMISYRLINQTITSTLTFRIILSLFGGFLKAYWIPVHAVETYTMTRIIHCNSYSCKSMHGVCFSLGQCHKSLRYVVLSGRHFSKRVLPNTGVCRTITQPITENEDYSPRTCIWLSTAVLVAKQSHIVSKSERSMRGSQLLRTDPAQYFLVTNTPPLKAILLITWESQHGMCFLGPSSSTIITVRENP